MSGRHKAVRPDKPGFDSRVSLHALIVDEALEGHLRTPPDDGDDQEDPDGDA